MSKVYKTAQGKAVDIDALRLANEAEIAVGNMKTNARGDELGPGGVILKNRNQLVNDYYQSNAVYTKERVETQRQQTQQARSPQPAPTIQADEQPVLLDPIIAEQDAEMDAQPQLRGKLADAVAKSASVEQKLLTPRAKQGGIKRM
jgi:hypothetical protein